MSAMKKGKESPIVQQQKLIQNLNVNKVMKEVDRLSLYGWRVQSFGWANGFQGGWYCLMTMLFTA